VPRVIRTCIVAIVSFLALIFASSAAAASSQGATVLQVNDCQPVGVETLCSIGHIVFNTTGTPSGLLSTTFHDDIRQSYTGGACTTQVHDHTQMHHLNDLTDGTTQEDSIVARESFVFACGTVTLNCESLIMIHQANGEFQYNRGTFVCTQV
jgi:hypothetical protein